ncbi:hypothetical protein EJB05_26305, partial [Eragrostis curvula]
MAAADRLSDLPDDLLRRILRFAPAKEGAATAVLSRRWRWLWRTSGAVNLDTRSYDRAHVPDREAFLRHAAAALSATAAHGAPVTRLSLHMEADHEYEIRTFVSPDGRYAEHDMISDVMAHTSARPVEELSITAHCPSSNNNCIDGFYKLRIAALPHEAVQVLHIVRAEFELVMNKSAAYYFPQVTTLLLQHCEVSLAELQDIMNGAPLLTTLRLESIFLLLGRDEEDDDCSGNWIRGPEVTTLVMTDCQGFDPTEDSIELDMPKLQYFTYAGLLSCQVWMKSQANFSNTRVLKLKLNCPIDNIAVVDMRSLDELLDNKLLYNLERLEVHGYYNPANNVAGIAIANLLHCCPIVCDLRLKIEEESRGTVYQYPYVKCKNQQDFDKSVINFRLRRGTSGGNHDKYEVSDIHGLSEHSFNCLQSCLRRVCLQFRKEEVSLFAIQLVKFFAENAMVLEEMHIDDGNHKMCEHVNDKVQRWALNAAKRRNGVATKGFRVLPINGERKIKVLKRVE